MSNVLTYPELWLLELSTKYGAEREPFFFLPDNPLTRQTGYCEQWNCPANGLSARELCEVLWNLFESGEITFQSISGDPDLIETVFVPADSNDIYTKMLFEFRERRQKRRTQQQLTFRYHCYRVTPAGIARWEEYAIPDWDRYRGDFSGRLWEPGETVWSQSATTEEFAREVLDVYAADLFHPSTLHWETAVVTLHQPWTPFPGKELPQGVTLSLKVTEHDQRSFGEKEIVAFGGHEWFAIAHQEHYHHFCHICHWYQNGTHNHPARPAPQRDA
jgi:hypothetical protein